MIRTAIIYTRTNSKRLKNKAFKKIYNNKSLIERVIENTSKIKSVKNIILATTCSKNDLKFLKLKKKYDIKIFRGSSNDLIERTIKCSVKYKFDHFLRICGDRPFFDYNYIDNLLVSLNKSKKNKYQLITNNKKNKLVDQGLTIEILSAKYLKVLKKNNYISKYNLENITSYFYQNSEKFKIKYINPPKNWFLNNKYTVDTLKDLNNMKFLISKIGYNNFNINKANRILKNKYEN